MAEIIRLADYRRSTVRSPSGTIFPTLYRVQGYAPQPKMVGGVLEQTDKPDRSWPLQFYSITPEVSTPKVIEQSSTAITKFEPEIDSGWLYVRAHADEDSALEYCQGVDAALDKFEYHYQCRVFVTEQGTFSLYHRDAAREDCPDHLIIYTDHACTAGPGEITDWYHIVKSDGSVSNRLWLLMGGGG
jgi:hypothetical protein